MTKPKEYPLNRKGWVVIEVRRQGGNWDKCLRPVILTKGEKGIWRICLIQSFT